MDSNNTYYQRNKKNSARSIKNCYHQGGTKEKASECYKNDKERLQMQAYNEYRELSNEKSI